VSSYLCVFWGFFPTRLERFFLVGGAFSNFSVVSLFSFLGLWLCLRVYFFDILWREEFSGIHSSIGTDLVVSF